MTSLGCGASKWPASGHFSIDVDGTERTYIVEIPKDYNPSTSYKLVFAWHGFTITAEQVASPIALGNLGRFFVLEPRAQGTAIFVAPQGLDTMLLGQVGPGWDNLNGRDVAFARAMLDSLRASYCIDDARIFSAGVSMGGYFSNQLGCEMGDVFRAVASIIGGGPILLGGPQCKGPMPAWITHGNMDQINPFSQGVASRDYWAKANHCSTMTTPVGPAGCVAYEGCDASYPVHFCEFDGNHMIPDFAAEGMWNFFSQF
jgi:poly(3-hydroxybutyrate) depolymerase